MGRTKITLKDGDYDKISRLATRGVNEVDITDALGISYKTWQRIKKEDEQALEALEQARRKEEAELVGVLYEAATKEKSLTAAMFLLKTRFGYIEGNAEMRGNAVQVSITLPGAKDESSYLKEVKND